MSDIIGAEVRVEANDISEAALSAIVIVVSSDNQAIALRLVRPIRIGGNLFSHVVASIRHEGHSFVEVSEGNAVVCAVTFVSDSQFSRENPLDLSWWRGGNAAVAEITSCN